MCVSVFVYYVGVSVLQKKLYIIKVGDFARELRIFGISSGWNWTADFAVFMSQLKEFEPTWKRSHCSPNPNFFLGFGNLQRARNLKPKCGAKVAKAWKIEGDYEIPPSCIKHQRSTATPSTRNSVLQVRTVRIDQIWLDPLVLWNKDPCWPIQNVRGFGELMFHSHTHRQVFCHILWPCPSASSLRPMGFVNTLGKCDTTRNRWTRWMSVTPPSVHRACGQRDETICTLGLLSWLDIIKISSKHLESSVHNPAGGKTPTLTFSWSASENVRALGLVSKADMNTWPENKSSHSGWPNQSKCFELQWL